MYDSVQFEFQVKDQREFMLVHFMSPPLHSFLISSMQLEIEHALQINDMACFLTNDSKSTFNRFFCNVTKHNFNNNLNSA